MKRKYKIEITQHYYNADQRTPEFQKLNPHKSWYKLTGSWAVNSDYSNRTTNEDDADLLTRDEALRICMNHRLETKCHPPITVTY